MSPENKPYETVSQLLSTAEQQYSSNLALKMRSGLRLEKYTYRQLHSLALLSAELLRSRGMRQGDRVLLWAANSPSWAIAYLGILIGGGVAVPLDMGSTRSFASRVIKQTEPVLGWIAESKRSVIDNLSVPALSIDDLHYALSDAQGTFSAPELDGMNLAEIMFTSGTTGDPKGVMLTHQNLTSNVQSVVKMMQLDAGSRILSLLPLSHMLEQITGLLIPLHCGASIVYLPSRQPHIVTAALKREQVSAMILVPQALQLLMSQIEREIAQRGLGAIWPVLLRLGQRLPMKARRLLFRPIHQQLGGRLEFLACGGAHLEPALASKWEAIGIPILPGYGATEATAIATANSTQARRVESVGRPPPGQELRIASDGEVSLRGANISTGYWRNESATKAVFRDGWYFTGDFGRLDSDGFLHFIGRKKNLIVLADGMNVYPEDIENQLNARPEIREAVVVGLSQDDGRIEVHAAVLTEDIEAVAAVIRKVNGNLAPQQQIRGFTVWPEDDFPRTHTLKVKRHELMRTLAGGERQVEEPTPEETPISGKNLYELASEISGISRAEILPESTLGMDLGMDSLSTVEFLCLIEVELGVYVDEAQIPQQATMADLEAIVQQGSSEKVMTEGFEEWPTQPVARLLRQAFQTLLLTPLLRYFAPADVRGLDYLNLISGPALLCANHTSHLDTPIVATSLGPKLRGRAAVAAAADYWFANPFMRVIAGLLFNSFPMARGGHARPSMEHAVDLIDRGWSVLIFPEGTRSTSGEMGAFRSGVGLLAVEMGVPVIPIHISGLYSVLPKGARFPRRGTAKVNIGPPVQFPLWMEHQQATREIEARVAELAN